MTSRPSCPPRPTRKELAKLQGELVKLQYWVQKKGLRVIVVFEGRDAAGKGGVIKRITERVNPRVCRVVALPAPTEREKTQLVLPALRAHLPGRRRDHPLRPELVQPRRASSGSWGSAPRRSTATFLRELPRVERRRCARARRPVDQVLVRRRHARSRSADSGHGSRPAKRWKLSPMDLESYRRLVRCLLAREGRDAGGHRHQDRSRRGTSCSPTTRGEPGSTASRTC